MKRLEGKRCIITGAASGIGRASAELFAEHGAKLTLADIKSEEGETLAKKLWATGASCQFIETDVGDETDMINLVERAVEKFGGLDVIYNNAGGATSADGPVTDVPLDEFWRTIKVDLFGTFLGCRLAIPHLVNAGGGSIINTTSIRAMIGTAGADAYTSAKGGTRALTQALALQWASDNIRVNAIAPGVVLTERVRAILPNDDPIKTKTPLGASEAADVAPLALYLAADESRMVTGTIMPMDGGAQAV